MALLDESQPVLSMGEIVTFLLQFVEYLEDFLFVQRCLIEWNSKYTFIKYYN